MINARNLDLYGVDCNACGTERIGGDVFAVAGFHVSVNEVRPDGQWRPARLYFCSRRCAGKHLAAGLDGEDWQSAETLYTHGAPDTEGGSSAATPADAETNDAVRLAADR